MYAPKFQNIDKSSNVDGEHGRQAWKSPGHKGGNRSTNIYKEVNV